MLIQNKNCYSFSCNDIATYALTVELTKLELAVKKLVQNSTNRDIFEYIFEILFYSMRIKISITIIPIYVNP